MSEEARIAHLRARIERERSAVQRARADGFALDVDVGDDAAVLRPGAGAQAVSVDAQVEGVHFRRSWLSYEALGARAVHTAMSDLAAMGASADTMLLSLALPDDVDDVAFAALVDGVLAAARSCGALLVGGNLTRASELALHTTVMGTCVGAPLCRSGARVGDQVVVTGALGGAALGLRALMEEASIKAGDPQLLPYVERWRGPRARLEEGLLIASTASAAMDLSDGLWVDAGRLAQASGVSMCLELSALWDPAFAAACATVGASPAELAVTGGEDYELLFTTAPGARLPPGARRIGEVVRGGDALVITDASGRAFTPASVGFDHFAAHLRR